MRVLVVHNRYRSSSPSGEDRAVDQETAALEAEGCAVRRFQRHNDEIAELPIAQKVMIPSRVAWNPNAARALARAINAFGPDVVHVHNVYPLLSPSVLQAVRSRVPAVVTFHNYRPLCPTGELFRSGEHCTDCVGRVPLAAIRHGCYRGSSMSTAPIALAALLQRRLWRSVPSAYVFLSDAQRRLFDPLGLPAERCFVKANLVHHWAGNPPTDPIVAFVGRLDEAKGIRLLMDAWDRFAGPSASHRPMDNLGIFAHCRNPREGLPAKCSGLVKRSGPVQDRSLPVLGPPIAAIESLGRGWLLGPFAAVSIRALG